MFSSCANIFIGFWKYCQQYLDFFQGHRKGYMNPQIDNYYLTKLLNLPHKSLYTLSLHTSGLVIYCTPLTRYSSRFYCSSDFSHLYSSTHFPILFLKVRIVLCSFLPIKIQVNVMFSVRSPLFSTINSGLEQFLSILKIPLSQI